MKIERKVGEGSGLTYDQLFTKIHNIPHLLKYVNKLFDNNDEVVVFNDDQLWDIETNFDDDCAVISMYEPCEDLPEMGMNGWTEYYVHKSYNKLFGDFDYGSVTVNSGEVLVVCDEDDYISIHLLNLERMVDGIVDNTCDLLDG